MRLGLLECLFGALRRGPLERWVDEEVALEAERRAGPFERVPAVLRAVRAELELALELAVRVCEAIGSKVAAMPENRVHSRYQREDPADNPPRCSLPTPSFLHSQVSAKSVRNP
ncbi:hypothetical protein BIFGAL_04007 [Bifidobacterium gallicum DSM 20093 = LMG 11596]|uniref:Uncharacterized protein n=1 Tax=Bifidobacterium gallicum DSM 20093 = LMG 11596 TaxID=561180 RepID=D1NVW3_9BIFI|nr:hypothetical protein BIFGAL_04007 [Bifidobacterium gallicum DSM 20093 = LMG 11596]